MSLLNTCAVIVAGGSGTRFGNPDGKQLLDLLGRPVVSWSLMAFDKVDEVKHIVLVCPEDQVELMQALAVDPLHLRCPVSFAPSGAVRQESCFSGIKATPSDCELVAIHDGARPLITPTIVHDVIARLAEDASLDGALAGYPAIDTLKQVKDGIIEATPDRSQFWAVQTPQTFRREALVAAYEKAQADGFVGTDDASVVEHWGGKVACVAASRDNLKVTVPEDYACVEALLKSRISEEG